MARESCHLQIWQGQDKEDRGGQGSIQVNSSHSIHGQA